GQFRDLFFNDLSYHLYFISIILGLYLITPFIRAMVKNISRHQLEILLLVCIGLISLKQFYPNVLFVSHFQIGSSLMYFLLGYYLHTYELTRRKRIVIYILGGIGALAMTFGNYVLEYKSGSHHDQLFLYDGIFVVLLSTWVFMLFRYGFKHATTIGVVKKFILRLSSYSYGVYIAHPLVISFLWYSGVSFFTFTQWESTITFSEDLKVIFMFHGAWGAVVMTLIVFSCSSLVLYLADRAKVLKLFS
ncbi:MAG: acyltransferase, partial [Bacteroidota bacterium]